MGKTIGNGSWPPFEPENEAATKHGADSERRWRPIADALEAELLAERPWLAGHSRTVKAWARTEAQAQLIGAWLDTNGLLDRDGVPWPASNRLDRLGARAQSLRADLAEPPMAMARLLGTLTATAATAGALGGTDPLEQLMAEGRRLLAGWEQRQIEAVEAPDSPAVATDEEVAGV